MIDVEVLEMLNEKLGIAYFERRTCENFLQSFSNYLKHSRSNNDKIGGRTFQFLEEKLNKFINLFSSFGLQPKELIIILTNYPNILNILDSCYDKILLLGVIENAANTVRKEKLLERTKDFMISINKIYSRYKLICETRYDKCNWSNLITKSENEFCKIFVKKSGMPHQLFDDIDEVKKWLDSVDINEFDIEEFKSMDVNKEFVAKYEEKTRSY